MRLKEEEQEKQEWGAERSVIYDSITGNQGLEGGVKEKELCDLKNVGECKDRREEGEE